MLMATVIIVTYNQENTIAEAIESVLCQQTSYSFEIWIADDCSADSTTTICRNYATKNPEKIRLFVQEKNTNLSHIRSILCKLHSRYFSILDGDDCWCNKDKLEVAIGILERNPEYTVFAHDTIYCNKKDNTKKSLVHDIHRKKITNPVLLEMAPYMHTSSRVYRNVIDFDTIPERFPLLDVNLYYLMLDAGPLYFYDEPMSIYNITGNGIWSKLNSGERANTIYETHKIVNEMLGYKYDKFFKSGR